MPEPCRQYEERQRRSVACQIEKQSPSSFPPIVLYHIFSETQNVFLLFERFKAYPFLAFTPLDSGIVAFISFRRTIYRLNLFRFHILIEIQNYLLLIYKYFIFKRRVLHCFFIIPYR